MRARRYLDRYPDLRSAHRHGLTSAQLVRSDRAQAEAGSPWWARVAAAWRAARRACGGAV